MSATGTRVAVMVGTFAVAGLCLRAAPGIAAGQQARLLAMTYVANMGIMASSGDVKILVDALFDRPNPEYRAPAPDVLEQMVRGAAPFDGLMAALVTHNHPDHFDARVAVRFLESRRDAVLVAPADAAAEVRKAAAKWAALAPRVVSIDLKVGERVTRDVKGINVTAIRTLHSGNRESPMNLMYLIAFNGRRLFHEGDSPGDTREYERLGLGRERIDLALVHFWFALDPDCARFLQEVLKPDHVALGHLPIRLEGDAPAKIDAVRESYKDLFLLLPGTPARVF
jgi:L-ascorbate metabolism protein UlaG (beta-lactamase superfamily)